VWWHHAMLKKSSREKLEVGKTHRSWKNLSKKIAVPFGFNRWTFCTTVFTFVLLFKGIVHHHFAQHS